MWVAIIVSLVMIIYSPWERGARDIKYGLFWDPPVFYKGIEGNSYHGDISYFRLIHQLSIVWLITSGFFLTPTNALNAFFTLILKIILLGLPFLVLIPGIIIVTDDKVYSVIIWYFLVIGTMLAAYNIVFYCFVRNDRHPLVKCLISSTATFTVLFIALIFTLYINDTH